MPEATPTPLSPALRARLDQARNALLSIHKALLDDEKLRYEKSKGPIPTAGAYLQLVIHDPWFAWLHPMTELVVQIDELVTSRDPAPAGSGEALVEQARRLVAPSESGDAFQQKYFAAIQRSPEVAVAHAAGVRLLSSK